jgi:hypothetical protein
MAVGSLLGEKIPNFIIQEGKKRFGSLGIVFMRMQAVTGVFKDSRLD